MKNELMRTADFIFDRLGAFSIDGAEINASSGRTDEFNVEAGKFSLLRTTFNTMLSIKVISGSRKGTSVTNNLERDSVVKALEQAVDSANSSEPDQAEYIAEGIGEHYFNLGSGECDLDGVYTLLNDFLGGYKDKYPTIEPYGLITRYNSGSALYANTNGTAVRTDSAAYRHSVTVCARDGELVSSMNGFGFAENKLGVPLLENKAMQRLLADTEKQLRTVPLDGKFVGSLLVAPDCLAEFIYYVISNCVADAPLISGSSPWIGMLGNAVADSRLSISYDPLDPRVVCGARVTGDGHLAERLDIIKDGLLTGWALSQYGAKKTGLKRGGNTSGNIVAGLGDKSFNEMLGGIERGLLINRFSGGTPAQNGDFSGIAKNSFLIEKGKITDPVSETMVSGNLLDMLKNIADIGNEAACDGDCALPWMSFGGITVSGK